MDEERVRLEREEEEAVERGAGEAGQSPQSRQTLDPDVERLAVSLANAKQAHNAAGMVQIAHAHYDAGRYRHALAACEAAYGEDAYLTENLLLLGAAHFQLRNFSESMFFNQQCVRIDPNFAEAYSNLGNALKELGDVQGAIQFYLKSIKVKPRFCDAYNNLASAHMQLGQTKEAIETYQMALVLNPALVDAHSNLGNLYKAQGDLEQAKRSYLEAIRMKPDFAIAWSNLAGVFKEEGNLQTAIAYYREAIRLCPDFADAHSNLGNALKEQGNLREAIDSYETAIRIRPDFAIAHGNLASCYYDLDQTEEAIRSFKYAIQLEPGYPDAYNNLGNALRDMGELDEAISCYRTALRLKPDHPHAYNNLGNAMKDKGCVKEAIHCYVTAIRLLPRFAAAHSNLGSILKEQGKLDQCLAHYHEAITIDPMFADAYSNMGNAYKDLGRLEDAIRCYSTAIKISPGFADAYSNLASAYKDGLQAVEAIECYRKALELRPDFADAFANLVHTLVYICDWSSRTEDFEKLSALLQQQLQTPDQLPSIQPFHSLVYPLSLAELQAIATRYAERAKTSVALLDMPAFRFRVKSPATQGRIRIGYVSSDFGNHPLSHLMQNVFGYHDQSTFEVSCYALTPSDQSTWRKQIEASVEHFHDVSALHNGDVAQLIYRDGIDILVNLNGYTNGARNEIFALQPAPIQVAYMGFCGSMGADYIQYMIADRTAIPVDHRQYYTEKIVSMPNSYFVCDHRQSARYSLDPSELPSRADYEVPEDKFVFCNFNQLYKIDPAVFDVWMNVLKRVPNSVLWLLRFPSAGEANIRNEARNRGVRDSQLHFTDVAPKMEHIKRGYLADLFLDTPCCNAHTTACDILWSGTPMVTFADAKMASRVGASVLGAVGLSELATDSLEDYEEAAVSLATDPERLFSMRQHLETARDSCALFDTRRWVRDLEVAFAIMNERNLEGYGPTDIDVPDGGPLENEVAAAATAAAVDEAAGAGTGAGSESPGKAG